jgi:hypothetical protein
LSFVAKPANAGTHDNVILVHHRTRAKRRHHHSA